MASGNTREDEDPQEKTIKTAGRIVKYSREIYHLESVEEVANLTLEATPHFIEGHPTPTLFEIRESSLRVLASMDPDVRPGDEPDSLVETAYETGTVTVCLSADTECGYESEDVRFVDTSHRDRKDGGVTIAAPTIYTDGDGDSGAVLVVHWPSLPTLEMYHVKPVDYLSEHVATALVNIRSRERLERTRTDLEKRKEMLEVYDKLLRHDLGNDLQVITGFSDAVLSMLSEDEPVREHVEKINSTAQNSAALISKVGQTVTTLQKESEPEVKHLGALLSRAVESTEQKFEHLSIEFDPSAFEYEVYAGDLLESVFSNILSNAAVHNDRQIHVTVAADEPAPETVRIRLSDDGSGIDDAVREDIFEMGKKGPESDGTGFGLGLARSLVESYGGAIDVQESESGGAEFRITLDRV